MANQENKPKSKEERKLDLFQQLSLKRAFQAFWRIFRKEAHNLINLHDESDVPGTIDEIKKNIPFKGANVWVLAFSIIIASIGLNVDSVAVIIGAMLISPLMGPILGVGLSVGTNDWPTLLRSLKHFGIMVGISLVTAWIFFKISPLTDVTTSILSRIKPTILDVIVALAGGLAGIVAISRKGISNVVPGVAIATALMPPLCVAGFGIARGDLTIFLGAFYLFLLNSLFISLSTFMVIKYLRFPIIHQINQKKERRVRLAIIGFVLLVIIPSGIMFVDVVREARLVSNSKKFIIEKVSPYNDCIVDQEPVIHWNDTLPEVNILMRCDLKKNEEEELRKLAITEYDLAKVKLRFVDNLSAEDMEFFSHSEAQNEQRIQAIIEDLSSMKSKLKVLQEFSKEQTTKLREINADTIPYKNLKKVLEVNHPEVENFSYGKVISADTSGRMDTLITFILHYKKYTPVYTRRRTDRHVNKWLKARLDIDTLRVISD